MKILLTTFCLFIAILTFAQSKYEKDFNEFCSDIEINYAYLNQQQIDLKKIKEIYTPGVKKILSDSDFIKFMENVINEFHNGHISLNTNLPSSNRLIPSGQDLYIEKVNTKFYITDIRKGFGADLSGMKIGDEVISFNGKNIEEQAQHFLPKSSTSHNREMLQYALDMLFAGTHNTKRVFTVMKNGKQKEYYPDSLKIIPSKRLIEKKILAINTAYIKINNSLGDNQLIDEFDKALNEYLDFKNLIIDLTETPSGGNTTVARGIMGRFIEKPLPYQKHEYDEINFDTKRMWIEYVSPRKKQFKGNVYILVGHWTGSMGEGIAIGFDGMKRAKIIGTKMAGLIGAISGFKLTETNIDYQIPTERLYHINGTPRENFIPNILTKNIEETYQKINERNL